MVTGQPEAIFVLSNSVGEVWHWGLLFIYLLVLSVVDINMNTIFTLSDLEGEIFIFLVYYDKRNVYVYTLSYMHVFLVARNKWLIYMVLLIK